MKLDVMLNKLAARFRPVSAEEATSRLRLKYGSLRRLTSANNAALEVLADLQRTATGEFLFDAKYIRDTAGRALALGRDVVDALEVLTDRREQRLFAVLDRISAEVETVLTERAAIPAGPLVLELGQLKSAPLELVGAKIRRLSEIREDVGVPVPDGFAVTSAACHRTLAQEGLWASIQRIVGELTLIDKEGLARASEDIRSRILGTPWPPDIAAVILNAFDALLRRAGRPGALVSVRSSAVGEDGDFSFAGQYVSLLNVDRERLLEACKEVMASQFGPRAVVYYKARGLEGALLPMAVGVIVMVDARASGVLYTRSPEAPDDETMVLSGTWGLGPSTADGAVTPDVFRISRDGRHDIVESQIAVKDRMLLGREGGGLVEVEVPGWMRGQPCLTRDQIGLLASYGARLEQHYGAPQDVEWALDGAENIVVLQSRPLRMRAGPPRTQSLAVRRGLPLLLGGGVVASPGIAAGEVSIVREAGMPDVPRGAVIVARTAAPALAANIDRASAIVTEVGSAASHLATVAREFRIPAIFNAEGALAVLKDRQVVTVDAEMGNVYAGRIESLLELAATRGQDDELLQSPLFRSLRAVARLLTPLSLTDPRSRQFRPSGCRTLHDILRYAHEVGVQEMFLAGGDLGGPGTSLRLESSLPVDFYFIDLGGGLDVAGAATVVRPEQFRSRPLVALWAGLRDVPWSTEPAAGRSGLGSVIMTALSSRDAAAGTTEPNFVLVTDAYVNITFRFGFHFSRVDAYLSPGFRENYASVIFHGGAADARGRSRRLDFLGGILETRHWRIARRDDALFARIEALPEADLARELEVVGRLLVLTRQIDTLLGDDAATARAIAAFRSGDYTLGLGRDAP